MKPKKPKTDICYKCNDEFLSENVKYILLDYRSTDLLTSTQISHHTRILCPRCREKLDEWLDGGDT